MPLSLTSLRSMGHDVVHGIRRLLEALQFENDPLAAEHFALLSAIEQLRRGIPVDQFGYSYLKRLVEASPTARQAAMAEANCTPAELEQWQRQQDHLPHHSGETHATPSAS